MTNLTSVIKNLKPKVFPFIVAISALSVSASAAYYSVSGLSKLFAGASVAVMIMASSLEVAKLVIASVLFQYRKTLPQMLKSYLYIACFVLIAITSMGIYGFLASAYQKTASEMEVVDSQIALIENKRDNISNQLAGFTTERNTLNESLFNLREGLANNKIQYRDTQTGQIITTTSSSTRRSLEKQLDQTLNRQISINNKIDSLNTILFNLESQIVEAQSESDLANELGPLKYLAELTGAPMSNIINYLLMVIIFVFDPLAIALVIVANMAFSNTKKPTPQPDKLPDLEPFDDSLPEVPTNVNLPNNHQPKIPAELSGHFKEALKHAKRANPKINFSNDDLKEFF